MDHTAQLLTQVTAAAYDRYGEHAGWRNIAGLPMPTWDNLGDTVRGHWIHAICGALEAADKLSARDFVFIVDEAIDRIDSVE